MSLRGRAYLETWNYATPFVIARGVLTDAELLVVEVSDGEVTGWGEGCPMPHYGETPEGELERASDILAALKHVDDWPDLHDTFPKGAARNAVDCAIWDLRAKQSGRSVAELMGLPPLRPVSTVFTLGIAAPEEMGRKARGAASRFSLLKIKLGDWRQDLERIQAVRAGAPDVRLIVDVNEGWNIAQLEQALPVLKACGVEMVEQPLPAAADGALADIPHILPISADESCHTTADLERVARLYDMVTIKLDKTGGLTEAMRLLAGAKDRGLDTMIGCMLATSLGIAPGVIVAQQCSYVDLDAPLMLAGDRDVPLAYQGEGVQPPTSALWG